MSNSDIEQTGTVKGRIPNRSSLSGRISTNGVSLSGHISKGSGSGDFIIKMTVTSDDNGNYTVTSCDATIEQIDAAIAAEKKVIVIASSDSVVFELPMLEGVQGHSYYFGTFLMGQVIASFVQNVSANESKWQFIITQIEAEAIDYSNDALPNISTVGGALDKLVLDSHTHTNKLVLDKFAETDGNPTYNGEPIGGGAGDFIIKLTIEDGSDEGTYTVTSCDKTMEQIDEAVASGQNVKAIVWDTYIMPLIIMMEYGAYQFQALIGTMLMQAAVVKDDDSGADVWEFYMGSLTDTDTEISAYDVTYGDTTVKETLDGLGSKAHTHSNKDILDKFGETDGQPTYNGELIGGDSNAPIEINSWSAVQQTVRLGIADVVFSIGDQLVCNHETYGTLVWDIIGIDHDTPADSQYKHSLTIQLHDCLGTTFQFDDPEPTNPVSSRKSYGSNNWLESGIRQWLNSDGNAGTWWEAKTEYDAKPSYASSTAGFLKGLDAEFLSTVGEVSKITARNTITDGGDSDTSTEKFFLLSMTEVYGGLNDNIAEGVAYPYYADNSVLTAEGTNADANRIKYINGAAKAWWLRSPRTSSSSNVRSTDTAGYVVGNNAYLSLGIAPACCII